MRPHTRRGSAAGTAGVVAVGACWLIASTAGFSPGASGPQPPANGAHAPASPATLVVAAGHGWTAGGVSGLRLKANSCRYRHAAHGQVLPDPRCTPGALDGAVTSKTLRSTVCRPGGYTATVRPPVHVTTAAKHQVMAAYGVPWSQARNYELDHLVELSAGGASDIRNLWPQKNTMTMYQASQYVHNDKDAVEGTVRTALCAGTVTLAAAQKAVAGNWTTAASVLHLNVRQQ